MDNNGKKILFFAELNKILKEYFPLIEALQDKGFVPVVVVGSGCSRSWLEALEAKQIQVEYLEEYAAPVTSPKSAAPLKASFKQKLLHTQLGCELRQVAIFINTLRDYRRLCKMFKHLFDRVRPNVIVLPGEGNLKRMVPLSIARQRGIPSLLLPIFYATNASTANYFANEMGFENLQNTQSMINRLLMSVKPAWAYTKGTTAVLRDPGGEMLATSFLGLLPKNPWTIGTGLATRLAVQNKYEYRIIVEAGADKAKMAITGKPREDVTFQQLQVNVAQERQRLGIMPGKKVLLCSLPHYAEHGMMSWEEHWRENAFLLEALDCLPDTAVLLTLYPDSDEEKYRAFIKPYKAILPKVHDVSVLMGLCDVYVTNFGCSTLPLAIGAKKPAIVFHFLKGYGAAPLYEVDAGIEIVYNREDFYPALHKALTDKKTYDRLVELQSKAAQELCMLDGKCTERVIDQMEILLSVSRKPE